MRPYERIEQYENGFDIDLSYPDRTETYRVLFRATPKGGVTDIGKHCMKIEPGYEQSWFDFDLPIPDEVLTIIRKYSKLYYNVEF
jgi:hypothetical protein